MKVSRAGWLPVLLICVCGCEETEPVKAPAAASSAQPAPVAATPQSSAPVPPSAAAPGAGGPIRAENATGVWNQSQVEQYLREEVKLASVTLKPEANNGYSGTGQGVDGTSYTLQVRQVPGGIKATWSTSTGGSGHAAFGNPVP